jgi:hypothetical protein
MPEQIGHLVLTSSAALIPAVMPMGTMISTIQLVATDVVFLTSHSSKKGHQIASKDDQSQVELV